jgi:hypothetical protein
LRIWGFLFFFFFVAVLGFELRAYTLSHSTSPFFCDGFFEIGSGELFPGVLVQILVLPKKKTKNKKNKKFCTLTFEVELSL